MPQSQCRGGWERREPGVHWAASLVKQVSSRSSKRSGRSAWGSHLKHSSCFSTDVHTRAHVPPPASKQTREEFSGFPWHRKQTQVEDFPFVIRLSVSILSKEKAQWQMKHKWSFQQNGTPYLKGRSVPVYVCVSVCLCKSVCVCPCVCVCACAHGHTHTSTWVSLISKDFTGSTQSTDTQRLLTKL